MANDPNLDTLDPDVTLDNNSISDTSDLDIDSQLSNNSEPPVDDEPSPADDFNVEDMPDDGTDPSAGQNPPSGQNPPPAGTVPPVPPAGASNNEQYKALVDTYLQARRSANEARNQQRQQQIAEAQRIAYLQFLQAQQRQQQQQSQPPQAPQPKNDLPPSEQDPVRYQYYLQLCRFMHPQQALQLVNQQDQYYEARFQKQFEGAMKQFAPYFERQAQEAYVNDLGNLASSHIQNFYAAASPFGVTPEESQAVVMAYMKAYIDAGHRDLADIHNWFSTNSARILAATIQEKRKIAEEQERSNAKNQYLAGKNAATTITPSTKAAANMVSTGQEALMKGNGAITGGAPSGTTPPATNGLLQSLAAQTGLNAFSAS